MNTVEVINVMRMKDRIRVSTICAISLAAAVMLAACTRDDRISAPESKDVATTAAPSVADGDLPEVVVLASRSQPNTTDALSD
jgi:uncharacterized lipoprotein YbaY